ncbi:GDSL-type esterase/lipase family protein [Nocardioides sp. CPCC 205120]|uniref:GDSL-type esterase/lipase family protein n=1 Tax=Nocardioides sp. CPCC 205120 TaxID=3406462 RepID=UPI003B502449
MARMNLGGGPSDFLIDVTSGAHRNAGPAVLTFWTAEVGGTQLTDVQVDGAPVESVRAGSYGHIPKVSVEVGDAAGAWVQAGASGPRYWMQPGSQGPAGPEGDAGPQGEPGPQGLPGPDAIPADEAVATYAETPGTATEKVLTSQFSRGDQAYNVTTTSLRRWRTALSGAEAMNNNTQRSARVVMGWNSIIQGAGLNAVSASAPSQLAAMFERELPPAGSGVIHMVTPSWFQQDGSNAVDNRINRIGTWAAVARGAFAAGCIRATGATNQLAYTDVGTEFVVYFARAADGGTMSVQVDGGAAATIDCSGTGLGSHTIVNTAATSAGGTALTDTSHVITITAPATGYAYITGVESRRGRTGVRVTRAGLSGSTTNSVIGTEESMEAVFDQAAPDLSVLLELVNDWLNADLPVATFKARWAAIIQRAKQTGDVLIVVPPISNEAGTYPFSDYETALYQLADEYDCALLNIRARWGTYMEANAAGLMGDAYHPSFKGYRDLARAIYEVIGTKAPGSTVSVASLGRAQTFTARQTFSAGLTIANGQSLAIGDVTIQRTAAFTLDLGTIAKASVLGAGPSVGTSLGAVNARASTGRRAVSAQGSDGTERGGFNVDGRLFGLSADMLASAPAAATRGVPWYDQNGTKYWLAAVPA